MARSGFTLLSALAIAVVAAIGAQRAGFQAANRTTNLTSNTSAGQLQQLTGTFVELLPLLMLAAVAALFLTVVRGFST
ncbi:MAG: hypothetical protein V5A22_07260 [Salinivenus sp.]